MSQEEEKENIDDPLLTEISRRLGLLEGHFYNLAERVSGLESRVDSLEKIINWVKERLEKLDQRLWVIVTGVIATFLVALVNLILRYFHTI